MSNINDAKIMELKKQIEDKKGKLAGITKFAPITNCSIELDGVRYNINTLQKEQLISLMVRLNSYMLSAKDLNILDDYKISGYKVGEWIVDIRTKLDILSRKDEEIKLKVMEAKLDKLLSDEKKTELELNEIADILKG